MKKESAWYSEINVVRGFAIFIILLYHAGFLINEGFLEFYEYFTLFGVPLFFFLSGLVLTLRYKKENLNLKTFYKQRFQYLLPAYLFWSMATLLISRNTSIYQMMVDTLTGDALAFWFLFVLFQLYLIFPILLKICKKKYGKWLFGIVLAFISISMILLWTFLFDSLFYRFYFGLIVYQNGIITVNISRFFWFIPFSVYFILGILIGLNYERFKEKLLKYKYLIAVSWVSLVIAIPIIIYFFYVVVTYNGYFNMEAIFYSIASILFFFLIFTQRSSKFFNNNGNISASLFLVQIFVLVLLQRFYFPAGWELFNVANYLGAIFFAVTSVSFFFLAYKLWGVKFFYFSKKIIVIVFLVPMVTFLIILSFLSFPSSSQFDLFVRSVSSFYMIYLISLILIALIKEIPHYQYIITEIRE